MFALAGKSSRRQLTGHGPVMLALISTFLASAMPVQATPRAVATDPPRDQAHPASLAPIVIMSHGAGLNAVMYLAAGAGPHPTLLLLHGLPGFEQNLDLAQAARRAGWNVLTFHYRGSWGSGGAFSLANCEEDVRSVLAYLRQPKAIARYGVDPNRIAIAGHSMGGIMAARAAADDPRIVGTFLIDPIDVASLRRSASQGAGSGTAYHEELQSDLPPLSGTSEAGLIAEVAGSGEEFDLIATMPKLADRPLVLIGARQGLGAMAQAATDAAHRAGARKLSSASLETDHSFSDKRISLASMLVCWLEQFKMSSATHGFRNPVCPQWIENEHKHTSRLRP